MSFFINNIRSTSLTRFRNFSRFSKSQTSSKFSHSLKGKTANSSIFPKDSFGRIKFIGEVLGLVSIGGMLFDTFYRRVTKEELNQAVNANKEELNQAKQELSQTIKENKQELIQMTKENKQELIQMTKENKQELSQTMGKLDAKIDGLTQALLHMSQRDRIAAETENQRLLEKQANMMSMKKRDFPTSTKI